MEGRNIMIIEEINCSVFQSTDFDRFNALPFYSCLSIFSTPGYCEYCHLIKFMGLSSDFLIIANWMLKIKIHILVSLWLTFYLLTALLLFLFLLALSLFLCISLGGWRLRLWTFDVKSITIHFRRLDKIVFGDTGMSPHFPHSSRKTFLACPCLNIIYIGRMSAYVFLLCASLYYIVFRHLEGI